MDHVRQVLRYHHYAYRTEQTDCDWIVCYVKFHGSKTHPAQIGDFYCKELIIDIKDAAQRAAR